MPLTRAQYRAEAESNLTAAMTLISGPSGGTKTVLSQVVARVEAAKVAARLYERQSVIDGVYSGN